MIDTDRPVALSSDPHGGPWWDRIVEYWPMVTTAGVVVIAVVLGGLYMSHSSAQKHRARDGKSAVELGPEAVRRLTTVEMRLRALSEEQTLLHGAIQRDLQDLERRLNGLERKRGSDALQATAPALDAPGR